MKPNSKLPQCILTLLLLTIFFSACDKEITTDVTPEIINSDISTNTTLTNRSTGVDYQIDGCIEILSSAVLTIEPGVVIEFTQNSCLEITDFAVLNAVGTANNPIIFTGQQKTKGFWKGIAFYETNNTNNKLTYCTIEYAGTLTASNSPYKAALKIGDTMYEPARIALNNVTIQHNLNAGIYIFADSFIDVMKNNTFTDNDIPFVAIGRAVAYLDADNNFTTNTKDQVVWATSSSDPLSDNATFTIKKLPVPYYLGSNDYEANSNGSITIDAGVKMIMKTDATIRADAGTITMNGTANNRIIIEGESHIPNAWEGILAINSGLIKMDYVTVNDGGEPFNGKKAVVTQVLHGGLQVTNCIFSNYPYYGLSYEPAYQHNADINTSNTCTGNTGLGCIYEL